MNRLKKICEKYKLSYKYIMDIARNKNIEKFYSWDLYLGYPKREKRCVFFFSELGYTKNFQKMPKGDKIGYRNFIEMKQGWKFRPLATLSKVEFNLFIGQIQEEIGIIEED